MQQRALTGFEQERYPLAGVEHFAAGRLIGVRDINLRDSPLANRAPQSGLHDPVTSPPHNSRALSHIIQGQREDIGVVFDRKAAAQRAHRQEPVHVRRRTGAAVAVVRVTLPRILLWR